MHEVDWTPVGNERKKYHVDYSIAMQQIRWKFIRGLILGLHPANERRRYNVTPSLIVAGRKPRVSPALYSWIFQTSAWSKRNAISPMIRHCIESAKALWHFTYFYISPQLDNCGCLFVEEKNPKTAFKEFLTWCNYATVFEGSPCFHK